MSSFAAQPWSADAEFAELTGLEPLATHDPAIYEIIQREIVISVVAIELESTLESKCATSCSCFVFAESIVAHSAPAAIVDIQLQDALVYNCRGPRCLLDSYTHSVYCVCIVCIHYNRQLRIDGPTEGIGDRPRWASALTVASRAGRC